VTEPRPAPYPPDTRAKGWRFELDYERIEQSDTWALAEEVPMAQHALMFMWLVAWRQVPCGSLPADEVLIRTKCRIPVKLWHGMAEVLLRGWWQAEDGRLYHPTITARVLEMLDYRAANAKRVAKHKEAKREQRAGNALPTPKQPGSNDTGTGTSTGTNKTEDQREGARSPADGEDGETLPDLTGFQPTAGGAACKAIKAAGIPDVNPSHPDLQRLLAAGVTAQELADAAVVCVHAGKPSFKYLLATVEGQRRDAAAKAAVPAEVAKPVTVPANDKRGDDYLAEHQARSAEASKPPAHLLALAGKAVRTA
jgi:hypothetical protein